MGIDVSLDVPTTALIVLSVRMYILVSLVISIVSSKWASIIFSPYISQSADYTFLLVLQFEISGGILRNQKCIIGLGSFYYERFIYVRI